MFANKLEKYWPVKAISLAMCLMLSLLSGVTPAQAQNNSAVTVLVLDENGAPVAFLPVELILFEYGASIEAVPVGGCGTDESGSCTIPVTDPPEVGGWVEGLVLIPGLGQQYIGWKISEKNITETTVVIQLLPGNVMATPESFLHFPIEGQDESGTDVPLEMAATPDGAGVASLTLAPTTGETGGASATQTPENTPSTTLRTGPTATTAPTATPTPTPAGLLGRGAEGRDYLLWGALGAAIVAAVAYWFISRRSRPKPQKNTPKPEGDA